MTAKLLIFLQEEISPLRNAVETVKYKNKELKMIIARMTLDKSQSINPLSMILNGVIDAAVMGGTAKYQEVSDWELVGMHLSRDVVKQV